MLDSGTVLQSLGIIALLNVSVSKANFSHRRCGHLGTCDLLLIYMIE